MKVKLIHIEQGFKNWYMNAIAPLSIKAALLTPLVMMAVGNIEKKNATMLAAVLDENGEADIDVLHKEYATLVNQKGSIEISSLKLNVQDLDKIVEHIKKAVPPTPNKV